MLGHDLFESIIKPYTEGDVFLIHQDMMTNGEDFELKIIEIGQLKWLQGLEKRTKVVAQG